MKEDLLHYVWKYKKINFTKLRTVTGEPIKVKSVGQHNHDSGPDFFNAMIEIGDQLWAGNVEMHVKSSDWYLHNHELNKNYDNVILHVVWEHDTEIFRDNNSAIATLELKHYISDGVLRNYKKLITNQVRWINCEGNFSEIEAFVIYNWLDRLYFERLECKSKTITSMLQASKYDWEEVLFKMLTKNFGLKVNSEAFLSLANATPFSIVRKVQSNRQMLEALFFGQAGLLQQPVENRYYENLCVDYTFLSQKYNLDNSNIEPVQFFRLRPANFPTIRLSQLSSLYFQNQNLFSQIIERDTLDSFYQLFKVSTSSFWENHYTFSKESKPSKKSISKSFINSLLINTIIPLKFCFTRHRGETASIDDLALISEIKPENNTIIDKFNRLRPLTNSALHSQALIQLKSEYCDKNKCLHCAIGNTLLN